MLRSSNLGEQGGELVLKLGQAGPGGGRGGERRGGRGGEHGSERQDENEEVIAVIIANVNITKVSTNLMIIHHHRHRQDNTDIILHDRLPGSLDSIKQLLLLDFLHHLRRKMKKAMI